MLVDYEYCSNSKNLILSYIDKSGNIKLMHKKWESPTKFIITSDNDPERSGKYVTWSGQSVKNQYTRYPNKHSIYDFIDSLSEEEQTTLYDYNESNIFFVDIENEILTTGKPMPHLAEGAILSISIVHKNKALVLGTDPLTDKEIVGIKNDINNEYGKFFEREWEFKYIRYKNEYELLLNFFKVFVPKMAVMTGWNFINYDWVYLVNRARKVGVDPAESSFTRNLRESNPNDPLDYAEMPAHRIIVDYMELYAKWDTSIKVKESNSLDFVSEKILGVKKVNYEGNLKMLYEQNFRKFIFYNAIDSILVQMIHEKMKYVDILYGIATLSRVTCTSALSTLAITEGIFRKKLREQKNIVLCKLESDASSTSVKGGWVKEPIRGMSTWTCCFDFASLYPTTMRQFNISADSYKGQQIKDTRFALFNGHQIPLDPDDIITKNGAVFKNEIGVITQILGDIYVDRKKYKKMMQQKHAELSELQHELAELERSFN